MGGTQKAYVTASETEDYKMYDEILKSLNSFVVEKDGWLLVVPFSKIMIEIEFIVTINPIKRFRDAVTIYS